MFPATPACKRAVHDTIQMLKDAGHTIVKFDPPQLKQLQFLYFQFMMADEGANCLPWLKDDLLDQCIQVNMMAWTTPRFVRRHILK